MLSPHNIGLNRFLLEDFAVAKITPTLITNLGYKIFFLFGTINIVGMGIFSLYVRSPSTLCFLMTFSTPSLVPETKGRSLEDMDVIFGSISAEEHEANILKHEKGALLLISFS